MDLGDAIGRVASGVWVDRRDPARQESTPLGSLSLPGHRSPQRTARLDGRRKAQERSFAFAETLAKIDRAVIPGENS